MKHAKLSRSFKLTEVADSNLSFWISSGKKFHAKDRYSHQLKKSLKYNLQQLVISSNGKSDYRQHSSKGKHASTVKATHDLDETLLFWSWSGNRKTIIVQETGTHANYTHQWGGNEWIMQEWEKAKLLTGEALCHSSLLGNPLQSSSIGVCIFFSLILSYFCLLVAALRPCQGKDPLLKYINTYPRLSKSSLLLCSVEVGGKNRWITKAINKIQRKYVNKEFKLVKYFQLTNAVEKQEVTFQYDS